jgi:hypothetical protein
LSIGDFRSAKVTRRIGLRTELPANIVLRHMLAFPFGSGQRWSDSCAVDAEAGADCRVDQVWSGKSASKAVVTGNNAR